MLEGKDIVVPPDARFFTAIAALNDWVDNRTSLEVLLAGRLVALETAPFVSGSVVQLQAIIEQYATPLDVPHTDPGIFNEGYSAFPLIGYPGAR